MSRGWALITGATGGLGGAIAARLAQRGHPLLLVGRNAQTLDAMRARLQHDAEVVVACIRLDLSTPRAAESLLAAVDGRPLSVVVLAAAAYACGRQAALPPEQHDVLLRCNVQNTARLLNGLLARLDAAGQGRMLAVGSLGALMPAPNHAAYSASKAWLHQFVVSLQAERRHHRVTLTLACPGGMATPMLLDSPAWPRLRRNPLVWAAVLSPEDAARQLLRAMDAGRLRVVPGRINRMILLSIRLLPHGLGIRLSAWLYGQPD